MIGAIAGDIIGSVYEFDPAKTKDFQPLFHPRAHFTDDTVLTVAVADSLLHDRDPVAAFKDWGHRYPDCGWGGTFAYWLFSDRTEPYGSFGNGAAMRISPVGLVAGSLDRAHALSDRFTRITHDHPEGLKGAAATVTAILLCRKGKSTLTCEEIRCLIEVGYGYDLSRSVAQIRPGYGFDETCQGTVPEAITCALEASDFEDAVRNAVSLGGDADTLGAITGGIAEARFGVPRVIAEEVRKRLPQDMQEIMEALYERAGTACPWQTST
ncbi:ADP-ribosyl-[dinitrogen reductase] hydrolase [Methylomarinovum tepidoasis]|uniref:ADP-ribosyl-[dinitrogen reductase] hydrolase n=1 Tax=Methylomarinovum tepidoasis TaxID=2840183 RepID=A0AAU9CZF8_9GAMM|nr:ADP-ribosylglycohydrolase family protein [Methylomarinovum sp. IN45]BCX89429.1 ADP-ribosyl-[dinitrogen reductase] hydrolase [Methylomarinovum sp. IN45]